MQCIVEVYSVHALEFPYFATGLDFFQCNCQITFFCRFSILSRLTIFILSQFLVEFEILFDIF